MLFAANAYYGFICCDIGPSGRFSDERVTECTKFYEKLVREKLNPPLPRKPDIIFGKLYTIVFVWDESFSLPEDY